MWQSFISSFSCTTSTSFRHLGFFELVLGLACHWHGIRRISGSPLCCIIDVGGSLRSSRRRPLSLSLDFRRRGFSSIGILGHGRRRRRRHFSSLWHGGKWIGSIFSNLQFQLTAINHAYVRVDPNIRPHARILTYCLLTHSLTINFRIRTEFIKF